MTRKCEACGTDKQVYGALGGVMLCKAHHADISDAVDALREQGKPVDVTKMARRIYRELHPDENVITPHKGGRSEVWPGFRITPEDKERLSAMLAVRGLSFADWVAERVTEGR